MTKEDEARDCVHGSLRRQCLACELQAQVATLTAERDEQAARVAVLVQALERIGAEWAVTDTEELGPLCNFCGQSPENCEADCLRLVAEAAIRARAGSPAIVEMAPCYDCGSTSPDRSPCPQCHKVFCDTCAEAPYEFCCDKSAKEAQ